MSTFLIRITLTLLVISIAIPQDSEGQLEQWCVADEQVQDKDLQAALNWACKEGGADCSQIQPNQPCFLPNTVKDHASFAFNSYFQRNKHKGGSCYFRGAGMITQLDPSYGSCHYEQTP